MPDKEKVIKGLKCCTQPSSECADDCPYVKTKRNRMACCDVLMADALALLKSQEQKCRECGEATNKAIQELQTKLKAQEPRVMTLGEAVGIIDRPVYLERNVLMPDKSVNRQECWALVQATDDEHMIRIATPYGIEKWHVGAYGIGWRCWTSRPTDAQREAIPWE